YFVIPESLTGKSLGKAVLKIKVVKQDGDNITFSNSLVRHLFDIIDWLPFCFIVYIIIMKRTEYNQRVGDIVAKTIVIQS
ncbi:RDD family protein, partial [Streptomyces brasiliscabiei]